MSRSFTALKVQLVLGIHKFSGHIIWSRIQTHSDVAEWALRLCFICLLVQVQLSVTLLIIIIQDMKYIILYDVDIWCYSWPKHHIMCWDSSSHYYSYLCIRYELHASELLCCISRSLDEIRAEWQTADRGIYTTTNTSLCKHPLISLQPASFSPSSPTSCFRRSCLWFLKPRICGEQLIPLYRGIVMVQINWTRWERNSVSVCLCVIHSQCQ